MEQEKNFEPELIYCYSRKQALADGIQVDVSETAQEAGLRFPVFMTQGAYGGCVSVPPGVSCQDEAGRLWDVVSMLRFAIKRGAADPTRLTFELYVQNSNADKPQLVTLAAECGPLDFDDPRPAITVMLPDED